MLGVLRMDIETCTSSFREMAPKIFPQEAFISGSKAGKVYNAFKGGARFDPTKLETIVKEMVASKLHTEDAILEDESAGSRPSCVSPTTTIAKYSVSAATAVERSLEPGALYGKLLGRTAIISAHQNGKSSCELCRRRLE